METSKQEWVTAAQAWELFVRAHPELGYRVGKWQIHNFLRLHRTALVKADAIRKAKNRFWIAHLERFIQVAFDASTGVPPSGLPRESDSLVDAERPTRETTE